MAVLVLADHDQGRLTPSTARVVAAAERLGPVEVLVAGEAIADAAEAARALAGVHKVWRAEGAEFTGQTAEAIVPLLERLAGGYTHIVASAGTLGRDVIPRLAARLDLMPVTDVVAIHGPEKFDRPTYAGNAIETVVSPQPRQVMTVRTSAFSPARSGGEAPVEDLSSDVKQVARMLGEKRTAGDVPDLSSAQIVVAGGVAVGSAEGFRVVEGLAHRLGAAVGATRAAVDAGYAPNDWQVGQTGKIVAPDLYIGVGISGALQHLAGIQGAKRIIAINTDPEAPLMKLADFALVGDLFVVVPELIAELDRLGVKR